MRIALFIIVVLASLVVWPVAAQEESADCTPAYMETFTAWQAYLAGGRQGEQPAPADRADPCVANRMQAQIDAFNQYTPPPPVAEPIPAIAPAPPPPVPQVIDEVAQVRQSIAVSINEMQYAAASGSGSSRISDRLAFVITMTNTSPDPIRAFTGEFTFRDLFDRTIKTMRFTYDDAPIAPGQTVVTRNYYLDYNQFRDADRRLREAGFSNLQISFEPASVLFMDGRRIGTPR